MENSFGHLKEELVHHVRFLSTEALATALNEYIRWYNGEKSAQNPRA
ncbi:IS3 family transposase [Arthrobacter sp.]